MRFDRCMFGKHDPIWWTVKGDDATLLSEPRWTVRCRWCRAWIEIPNPIRRERGLDDSSDDGTGDDRQ